MILYVFTYFYQCIFLISICYATIHDNLAIFVFVFRLLRNFLELYLLRVKKCVCQYSELGECTINNMLATKYVTYSAVYLAKVHVAIKK
jgi:hypothetical protein